MHLFEGFVLTIVFMMAHVVEGLQCPVPDEKGNLDTSWAVHQLNTTANFAIDNPYVNFFCGGLNFQIDGVDHLQLTKYVAPSGHYDYHIDGNGYTEGNSKVRKISMTCLLNDDFEGGDFNFRISKEYTVSMKQGDIIFFPSYFPHKVTPGEIQLSVPILQS